MYNVSDAYVDAINRQTRTDKIAVEIFSAGMDLKCVLTDEDIAEGTLTVSRQCVNNDYFEFGAAYASQLQFHTRTHKISLMYIIGCYVRVTYSLLLDTGDYEDVPVGMFCVTECEYTNGLRKITAYDCLVTLDWEGITFGATAEQPPYEMLKYALWANEQPYHSYGMPVITIELGNSKEEIEAMPNGTIPMKLPEDMQTPRELLSSVAELLGCYIEADKTVANKIWLKRFRSTYTRTIKTNIRFDYSVSLDWDRPRDVSTKIAYQDDGSQKNSYQYVAKGGGTFILAGGYRMMLDNKILNITRETNAKQIADTLAAELSRINQEEYLPISFSFFGDPALDVGDMVECAYNNTSNPMLIGGYVWNYRNAESITAIGGNKSTDVSQSPSGIKNESSASGGSGTGNTAAMHYYEYTNPDQIIIHDGGQTDTAVIRAVSYRATDVVFLAEIAVDVETTETILGDVCTCTDGVITAAYFIGNVEIGSVRPSWTLQDGTHTIHLMHHFTLSGYDAAEFHVKLYAQGCTVQIRAQALHAVLEGTYLAGQEAWDGLINAYDTIGVEIGTGDVTANAFTDSVNAKATAVMQSIISDTVGIEIGNADMIVTGFGESIQTEWEET